MFFIAVWSPRTGVAEPASIRTPQGSLPVGFATQADAQKFVARSGSPPNCTAVSWEELRAMNPRAFENHPRALLFTTDMLDRFFADPRTFPYERFIKELPIERKP